MHVIDVYRITSVVLLQLINGRVISMTCRGAGIDQFI